MVFKISTDEILRREESTVTKANISTASSSASLRLTSKRRQYWFTHSVKFEPVGHTWVPRFEMFTSLNPWRNFGLSDSAISEASNSLSIKISTPTICSLVEGADDIIF